MAFNRRKFIHTSIFGVIAANTTSSFSFFFNKNLPTKDSNKTIAQLLREAAIKRKSGDLVTSQQIYQQVIEQDINEIRAYDGIRKILLSQKNKELEVVQLYSTGFNLNPNNPIFIERLSKEYMRLSLGNKKFATQLNQTNDLLELARSSFSQLKNTHPNNIQFEELFNKARRKKNQNANIIDARDNIVIKKYKKNKRKQFKKRFDNFDTITLEKKLSFLLKKPRDIKRDEHIKELYRIIIKKHSKAKAGILVCEKAKNLYLYDTKDVNSLRIARRFCKKNKEFKILEDIERKNDSIKKTFWSKIGLFDILLKRFNKDSVGSYNEMKTILDSSYLLKSNPIHYFELETRKFKLYLIKDPIEALNQLKEIGISINGISSSHYINRYNILCVRYFKKIGETENALKVLNIAMNEETKEPQDLFFKLIYAINKEKKMSNTTHFEKLNKIRTKIISNNL